jgi:hypothetical protein
MILNGRQQQQEEQNLQKWGQRFAPKKSGCNNVCECNPRFHHQYDMKVMKMDAMKYYYDNHHKIIL